MPQYSHGYKPQSQMSETQYDYAPDPIDLQQFEQQQSYSYSQSSQIQQRVPPQQNGPQPVQHYTYVQHVFVYPRNEPDALSKIAAAVSYIGFWFSALIILLFIRNNRFVHFHAFQSLFLFGGMNVVYLIFFQFVWFWFHIEHIFRPAWILFALMALAFVLLNVIAGIAWLVGVSGAMVGKYVKLPFVGDLAERLAGSSGQPRQ